MNKTKVKCNRCEHEWLTKSLMRYVSCSNCLRKVEVVRENEKVSIN